MAMVRSYLFEEYLRKRLARARAKPLPANLGPLPRPPGVWASQFLIDPSKVREEKVSSIIYRVPAADIVAQWERQKEKYLKDLHEAEATQKDLKEKGVEDSCVNGKVDNCRRNLNLLTLQLQYMDREEDVIMMDHEMMSLFLGPQGYIDGPSGMGAEVARERTY